MTLIQQQIIEKIREHDTIIIHRHVNPDPDAIGSQCGLREVIQKDFPAKQVFAVGEEVEGLHFLSRMDDIKDEVYKNALVIVCDTANTERISDDRWKKGEFVIKIDHHPNRSPYGDLEWVDTSFSSTSEMIVDLIVWTHEIQDNITDESARLLYAGIVGDTGRFLYDNTKPRTMEYAGLLLQSAFDPTEIHKEFNKTSREAARLHGYILQNYEVTDKGVAYMFITKDLLETYRVEPIDAANLVNVLANIEGNSIWVFFVEYDEEIRVRIRSKDVSINEVAQRFNGGGHPLASGASVQNVREGLELIDELDNLLG